MDSPSGKLSQPIVLSCCRAKGIHGKKQREEILRSRGWHEFIARNSCGNSPPAVFDRLDAHDLSNAADIYIARLRNLLGKCNYEIDLAAYFEIGLGEKV